MASPPSVPVEIDLELDEEQAPEMDEEARSLLRLALFLNAMAKGSSSDLREGLADGIRARVDELTLRAEQETSSERQASLAQEFGPAPDVAWRLREAFLGAGPVLRRLMLSQLPAFQQAWVSDFDVDAEPRTAERPPPFLIALADRLVREATR
ncbi:MAG TPA: hypothetical protein VH208_03325 [Myxococcaceae bacterium]|nr:hypothetical protein [Myxococcaceae bacterium]